MTFKYSSNPFGQLSKGLAKGMFVVGLLLIGFGVLVYILKEVLAVIAAAIFVVVGIGCCINAVRMFIFSGTVTKHNGPQEQFRENVRIHTGDDDEI